MNRLFILLAIFVFTICCTSSKSKFSNFETNLINSGSSKTPMRVYKITAKKDSILLRKKSADVKPNSDNLIQQKFIDRLYATVRDSLSLGVGIAAPQVGILKKIIWVQRFDKENLPFEVYLNPKITEYSKSTQTAREGCLSIPNRRDTLNTRSEIIKIEYDTRDGVHKTESIKGFTSIIFQHEIDHLNGILYLDHIKKDTRNSLKTK